MSHSPNQKPMSAEARAHMMAALSGMELPPSTSDSGVGGLSSLAKAATTIVGSGGESLAAAGRTATVEDMFNLAAPEVDAVMAKFIPMAMPNALPSSPIEVCEVSNDKEEAGATSTEDTAAAKRPTASKKDSTDGCPEATQRGLLLALKIGRSKDLPISSRVDHPRMSSYHCEVYYHPLTLQLFLRDVSTNGTFLNGSVTRMEKGALVELNGGEMIQLVNPQAPANTAASNPLPSTTYLLQRIKATKAIDDEALEDELTCGITKMLLYKPVMALPCLHTFSAHALAQWIDAGNKTCPECRGGMSEVRPSHKVSNLLEQFLKAKAATITYYTKDEMEAFDKQNTIPPTGKLIAGGPKRRPNWDDPDYFDDEDEEYDEEDEDDDGGGGGGFGFGFGGGGRPQGMAWVPQGLPFSFGQFSHAAAAIPPMPMPTCPECNVPAPFDGFQCPATASHINCHMCKTPFPERPLCGIPQRCALCALPFCDMYFKKMSQPGAGTALQQQQPGGGSSTSATPTAASTNAVNTSSSTPSAAHPTGCRNLSAKDYFKPIGEHTFSQLPASLFGGNIVEQSILSMYLATGGCPTTHFQPAPALNPNTFNFNLGINNNSSSNTIPVHQVWKDCLAKFTAGLWVPDIVSVTGPLTVNTAVCQPCCGKVFSALLFHYRRAINKDDLPPAILNRPNCWYGIHCRTQFHNTAHAQNYNHVCPQEKRKE